jgi:beta-N-acetylglucosaminidase
MKKFLCVVLALIFVFSFFKVGYAYEDFPKRYDYAEEAMNVLIDKGILKGNGKGDYFPGEDITRAEFAAFVVRSLDLQTSEYEPFPDVAPSKSLYVEIHSAAAAGIVTGYPDGTFRPDIKVTREQMAVMINRALSLKGIVADSSPITFDDKEKILEREEYYTAVKNNVALGIIIGDNDNHFRPKDYTIRADAALVIKRTLDVLEQSEYSIASISSNGEINKYNQKYQTYEEVKSKISGSNELVLRGDKIVWMKEGITHASGFTVIYSSKSFGSNITYVSTGSELKYLGSGDTWVKVQLAGATGYIKQENASLQPFARLEKRSYYKASDGNLYHHVVSGLVGTYTYGSAPDFMEAGTKYYSWDGNTFYTANGLRNGVEAGTAYQYFNSLPLYTKTDYTAEELDRFIAQFYPDRIKENTGIEKSPLEGLGASFKKAEKEYGTNALYFLAHAIHESAWGTSSIARDKNNLFGLGASDSDPYGNAYTFNSFEEGILEAARSYIIPGYFKSSSWSHNGAFLGDKGMGMNVRYASDPYWGQKIAGYMYQADKYLKGNERNEYKLAVSLKSDTNVRTEPVVTNDNDKYELRYAGIPVQVLDTVNSNGEVWHKIAPKNIKWLNTDGNEVTLPGSPYESLYVYSHGNSDYGTNFRLLPLMK